MGLFLSMSGVIGSTADQVEGVLQKYVSSKRGQFVKKSLSPQKKNCLVILERAGGVTVLYPTFFCNWDDVSEFLSKETGKPVFSFHIHDGDLWMYTLYENSKIVDQFNPVPDYWQDDLDDDKCNEWRGNASEVSKRVPGLSPDSISKYLVRWGDDGFDSDEREKAYPDDRSYYGDDWQLVDFMKRLGLDYPIDEQGSAIGTTYSFVCE